MKPLHNVESTVRAMLKMTVAVFVIGVLTIGCSKSPADPNNPTSRPAGTLYINGDNNSNVYALDLATGVATNVFAGSDPFRTAEGTFIAVTVTGLQEISANGVSARMIVETDTDDGSQITYNNRFLRPQLSPDGQYIAYYGFEGYAYSVYVVNRTTGELLLSMSETEIGEGYKCPSWLPDNRIVVDGLSNNPGTYITDADWTTLTRIDEDITAPSQPSVSPDGKTIALIINKDVYTMNIDGNGRKQITTTSSEEELPTWSPDGKYIAYYGENSLGSNSILLLNVATGTAFDVRSISTAVDQLFTFSFDLTGQIYWRQ